MFPRRFDDEQHIDIVLSELSVVATSSIRTFALVGRWFYLVEVGPARAHRARMIVRVEPAENLPVVEDILNGAAPFPAALARKPAQC